MQEMWVQSLVWEDPLDKEMAIHSSILAWEFCIGRGAWQATVHGAAKESDLTQWLNSNRITLPRDCFGEFKGKDGFYLV